MRCDFERQNKSLLRILVPVQVRGGAPYATGRSAHALALHASQRGSTPRLRTSFIVGSIGMRLGLINRGERRISAASGVGTHVDYHDPVD